jgi:hypothetical protein
MTGDGNRPKFTLTRPEWEMPPTVNGFHTLKVTAHAANFQRISQAAARKRMFAAPNPLSRSGFLSAENRNWA